jgi:hypothetical protein
MKSVGEVMSIGRTFEESIQKAIRAIDDHFAGFAKVRVCETLTRSISPTLLSLQNDFVDDVDEELVNPTDKRIFAISMAFQRGYSVDKIWQMTNIDKWFLTKLQHIFKMEERLSYVVQVVVRPLKANRILQIMQCFYYKQRSPAPGEANRILGSPACDLPGLY